MLEFLRCIRQPLTDAAGDLQLLMGHCSFDLPDVVFPASSHIRGYDRAEHASYGTVSVFRAAFMRYTGLSLGQYSRAKRSRYAIRDGLIGNWHEEFMDRLSALMPFVRTAELGSFVEAGRSLGLSASAVGKGVTRLEAQLGVRLFQRTTRSLSLTDEGRMFQERCRRILDDLDDAQAALTRSAETPRGRLRVSLPIASYHLFQSGFLAFISKFPDIELDIDFSDHMVDLVDEGIDIAIRSGGLRDSRLIRRSLPSVQMIMCASPAYLDAHGIPLVPRDMEGHSGIRFRYFKSGKIQDWPLKRTVGDAEVRTKNVLVCNNMDMVRSALINGIGIGTIPDFLACDSLADGSLKAILTDYLIPPDPFSAVWPSSRQLSQKVRVFVDFISQRLEHDMANVNSSISESLRT